MAECELLEAELLAVTSAEIGQNAAIYRLVATQGHGSLWHSSKDVKLSGRKQVYRLFGENGMMQGDLLELADEPVDFTQPVRGRHTTENEQTQLYDSVEMAEGMLTPLVIDGKATPAALPEAMKDRSSRWQSQIAPLTGKNWRVSISEKLNILYNGKP